MIRRLSYTVSILPLVCLLAAGCSSSSQTTSPPAPTYTNFDPPNFGSISGQGTRSVFINNSGSIAAFFYDSSTTPHGYVRTSDGTITTFDVPGSQMGLALGTTVSAVNNSGTAAGSYFDAQAQQWWGFTRSASGQYYSLGPIAFAPGGSEGIQTTTVNDTGDAAGYFFDDLGGAHGFISSQGIPAIYFDPPGGVQAGGSRTIVSYLSGAGEAVGYFASSQGQFNGFVRHVDGGFTILEVPGAGGTQASMMNTSGAIVGTVINNGVNQSFLLSPGGTYTVFDPPGVGSDGSRACCINTSGVIAGFFTDANSVQHGYLRNLDGSFTIIDDPSAPQTSSISGTIVTGLNDAGAVVGTYGDAQGVNHAFVRH